MGAFIRWLIAIPLAALVTASLFLLIHNQIAPEPVVGFYRSPEDAEKVIIDIHGVEDDIIIRCMCGGWLRLRDDETSNSWTRHDKAVSEAPRVDAEKPARAVTLDTAEGELHYCNGTGGDRIIGLQPPVYPRACREKRAEGTVVVRFDITKEGKAVNISVVESADKCFNSTVIKMVSRRRYPRMCNAQGKLVARRGEQETFRFELEE